MEGTAKSDTPKIAIVCPVLNEFPFIENLVKSFTADSIPKEIYFVDAGSTDGSRELIEKLSKTFSQVKLIDNPEKHVSEGFNKVYKISTSKYISLLGAHAIYPDKFFENALRYLESNECDVVGGPLVQYGKTETGKIIAKCMSHRFGVGNTEFRTSKEKQYVQSVAFATYKREIFEKAGLFDTEVIKNQDDEFHYRIHALGYKILMVPEMECGYYVRDSISSLFKQYYWYGFYKPLVFKKVKKSVRLRHLIPPIFAAYFLTFIPLVFLSKIFMVPFFIYLFAAIFFAFNLEIAFHKKPIALIVFFTLHFSYGLGFLIGLKKII